MTIAEINAKVVHLMNKMELEEGALNLYVRAQLIMALNIYSNDVKRTRNRCHEQVDVELNISNAISMLHNLPVQENNFEITTKSPQELEYMRGELLDRERQTRMGVNIHPNPNMVLHNASYQAQHLDRYRPLNDTERINVSFMFLTLYIHSPPVRILEVLTCSVTPYLRHVLFCLENINIQTVKSSDAELIKYSLEQTQSLLENTKLKCSHLLEKVEQKLYRDPNQILNTLEQQLEVHQKDIAALAVPLSEDTFTLFKEKLSNFNLELSQVPTSNDKKSILYEKAKLIEGHLVDIAFLTQAEEQISRIVRSKDFSKKMNELEDMKRIALQIDTINEAVRDRKEDTVTKISGFVSAEASFHLRHKLEIVEDYRTYAQEFAFPESIPMYNTKRNEINELKECVDSLPRENKVVRERLNVFNERVEEILAILDKKAHENKDTLSKLNSLQNISENISNSEKKGGVTLETFNTFRRQIEQIDCFHPKIIKQKLKVLERLHNYEKKIYEEHFPDIGTFLAPLLDKYLEYTRELTRSNNIDFTVLGQEFKSWQRKAVTLVHSKIPSKSIASFLRMFEEFFIQLGRVLQKNVKLNQHILNLETLEQNLSTIRMSSTTDKKNERLETVKRTVSTLKTQIKDYNLSKKLSTIERKILTEESKIFLENLVKDIKHLDSQISTLDKIEDILILKERIDDIPNESAELDELKKTALKELHSRLYSIDQGLAKFVFMKRQSENVINVENYFTKLRDDGVNKESVEFVKKVFDNAATFEEMVKSYMGTKDSLDYYIIHESLMRLLEELDRINSDDDVLWEEVAKVMDYIKGLKKQLLVNATLFE